MRKYSVWELICLMFAFTVCIVIVFYMLGAMIWNQQTNQMNLPLRMELIKMLNGIQGAIIAIAAMKINNLNKNNP